MVCHVHLDWQKNGNIVQCLNWKSPLGQISQCYKLVFGFHNVLQNLRS